MRTVAALALLLAAACGGHDPSPATPTPSKPIQRDPVGPVGGGPVAVAPTPSGPTPPTLRLDRSVVPTQYSLELALDPAAEEFTGRIAIDARIERATTQIWLHGKGLTIDRATIVAGGVTQDVTATAHGEFLLLTAPASIAAGPATITIEYRGIAPVSMSDQEGLFRQTENGETYLYSQFEATGARRAFPCFDEPSFKVPWTLTLRVPRGLVALSNTPIASQTDDGATTTVTFTRTQPMPSYLVAVAVGRFDLVDLGTAGANHTPMRIAVPKGRAAEARYAKKVSGELLAGLERYLGIPYPYAKLDSVVIPTFLGAMENPGLITYAAKLILAKPSEESLQFQRGYASVGAHEMAHHWFGDYVTMAWWDDIWLNESFADFMADRVVDDWAPRWGIRLRRLQAAQGAFAADSLISARKIHNPIVVHEDIIAVFDAISYAKGGAVLAMFEAWVGRDVFQKTLREYLTAHAWGNASSGDFIAALAAASRPELSTAFASFLDQGGIPMVSLDVACTGDKAELVLAQERFLPIGSRGSTDQTWSIPMCVATPAAKGLAEQCFLFTGKQQRVALTAPGCPAFVDGNAGGRGYYRVRYAGDLGPKLLTSTAIDDVSRVAALFNLRAMVDGAQAPMSQLLAVIPGVARADQPELLSVALELALGIDHFVEDAQRPAYLAFLRKSFAGPARVVGWKPRKDEPAEISSLRGDLLATAGLLGGDPGVIGEARKLAAAYVRKPTSLDPTLATVALAVATHAGDDALARKLDATFRKTEDHNLRAALLGGMVLARDPAVRAQAVARLATGELTLEELFTLIFTGAIDPTSRDEVYGFVTKHLDEVTAAVPFIVRPAIVRISGFYCDDVHRQELDTIFRPKLADLPGGEKELNEAIEAMDLCIAKRKAVAADVATFLSRP